MATLSVDTTGKEVVDRFGSHAEGKTVIHGTGLSRDLSSMSVFDDLPDIAMKFTGKSAEMEEPKSIQQGIATSLVAALDPSLQDKSGSYLANCNTKAVRDYAASSEDAERLWVLSEKLVDQKFTT